MDKESFKQELLSVKRDGIKELYSYLDDNGFFIQRASTKYHDSHEGGLADHSMNVLDNFRFLLVKSNEDLDEDSVIICSLLHDVCKMNLYNGDKMIFSEFNKGHGKYSVDIISQYITLTTDEKRIITYHMGAWYIGVKSFHYPITELNEAWCNDRRGLLFHVADDTASKGIIFSDE